MLEMVLDHERCRWSGRLSMTEEELQRKWQKQQLLFAPRLSTDVLWAWWHERNIPSVYHH